MDNEVIIILFTMALGVLLSENEGICIELDGEKYIVYSHDDKIQVDKHSEGDPFEHLSLVGMHFDDAIN